MANLKGKNILIGVSGGIAIYKIVDLISLIKKEGGNVKVIMTENAKKFVTPLTFKTISENFVYDDTFKESGVVAKNINDKKTIEKTNSKNTGKTQKQDKGKSPNNCCGDTTGIDHISLAKFADLFLVAPATANVLSKFAGGIADDLLSTTYLSVSHKPILVAPAMNTNMLNAKVIQRNLKTLKSDGIKIINPVKKKLACGDVGEGALADIKEIFKAIKDCL